MANCFNKCCEPPTRGLYFRVRMCGVDTTSFSVTIVGVSPSTYTATTSSVIVHGGLEGEFSLAAFGGLPVGEYTYTIARCNGHTSTGTTSPGVGTYMVDIEPPAGKIPGCCGEDHFFPATLTVSDATGSTVLNYVPGIASSCCCAEAAYSGQKVVAGFSGVCVSYQPGRCVPITVSLVVSYFVGCVCRTDGTVTFTGHREWSVVPNYDSCSSPGSSLPISALCCWYVPGGNGQPVPVTSGGSPSRTANEGNQACGPIDFTLDVTDQPFDFEGGGYPRPDCHPGLGNTLTVTE